MNDILFVDDEPDVLDGLKDAFHAERRRWHMEFAVGGVEALAALDARPFHVMVTDLRMPTMDGVALLQEVRHRHPRVTRIVLSGQASLAQAARATALSHRYLVKPCSAAVIRGHIERAIELHTLLTSEALKAVVGSLGTLPTAPSAYAELRSAFADPELDLKRIAATVRRNVGLAARVLHFANSAYCGFAKQVSGIEDAILRLGLNTLSHLALAEEVFELPADPATVEALHRHSALTGAIARRLVSRPEDTELAFTAGLLHDAGALVLASCAPEAYRVALQAARESGIPRHVSEKEWVGASHSEVGGYLFWLWDLPHALVEPIFFHHDLDRLGEAGLDLCTSVALASVLAHEVDGHPPESAAAALLAKVAPLGDLAAWRAAASAARVEVDAER